MIKVEYNKDLTRQNTFGMKVSCACYVEYDSLEDLDALFQKGNGRAQLPDYIADCGKSLPQPYFHIGGGSNLLFTGDFPGTVFHSAIRFIKEIPYSLCHSCEGRNLPQVPHQVRDDMKSTLLRRQESSGDISVEVGAGVVFDDFCAWAASEGLWGTENLSLIPGETGAAAVQNIGAYGVEVKDIIREVRCFDVIKGEQAFFDNADCRYGYRDSIFKDTAKGRYIVTSVVFNLSREQNLRLGYGHIRAAVEEALGCPVEEAGDRLTPEFVRNIIIAIRKDKLPDPAETGSAGSFFKNPVVPKSSFDKVEHIARFEKGGDYKVPHYDMGSGFVKIPAAWLIEQCGWKGFRDGNAGVYPKQPLVLVNITGHATPQEIISLEQRIIASVKDKFDISLHPEVEHI